MKESIRLLQPQSVWEFFDDICQIPRPSKKEEKIKAYLFEFGLKYNLETLEDEIGNILIRKGATKGYEDFPWLVMQSHIDMVCEKNSDIEHDFDNDPIQTQIDGEWVKANGTTLGADDGIGVATQLATEFPSCALVLQSPYTSMKALQRYHYPWLPAVLKDQYDSLQRMQAIHCPILVLHGKLDRIVPYQQGEALFESANQPKKLQSFPEQGHNNLWNKTFVHDVMTFIGQHCVEELSAEP